MKKYGMFSIAILIIAGIGYGIYSLVSAAPAAIPLGPPGSVHTHQDFRVYIDGKAIDFSQPRYQVRSQYVHVEDSDGDLLHTHATGVTFGMFLKSVGFTFNSTCLIADTGEGGCNSDGKKVKFYVNGGQNSQFDKYLIRTNDKILISYGNETDVTSQLASITSKAPLVASSP